MTGKLSDAINRIKDATINSNSNHCIHHQYALVAKWISDSLKVVLDETVQFINFIKTITIMST